MKIFNAVFGVIALVFFSLASTAAMAQAPRYWTDTGGVQHETVGVYCLLSTCSGGGGGGGGAVTAAAASFQDGYSTTMGALADAACSTDAGTCSELALIKRTNARLSTLIGAVGSPLQAGNITLNGGNGTSTATAANPFPVVENPQTYQLLSNASASGSVISNLVGGSYLLSDQGTYGGATISYKVTGPDGTTQTTFYTDTAGGTQGCVNIGAGSSVQATVAGGTPSVLYARLSGTGSCPNPIGQTTQIQGIAGGVPVNVTPDSVMDATVTSVTNGAATGANAIILGPVPTAGFNTGHIYISAQGTSSTGTIVQQLAADGVTWISTGLASDTSLGVTSSAASVGISWNFSVFGSQIRVIQSGVTAGTTVGALVLKRGTVPTTTIQGLVTTILSGTGNGVFNANSASSSAGVAPLASTAAVASLPVKTTGGGNLHGFNVSNIAAAVTWVYAINAVSAPASGSTVTPLEWIQIPANTTQAWTPGTLPAFFSTGVTLLCSSTGPTTTSFIFTSTTSCAFTAMVQ